MLDQLQEKLFAEHKHKVLVVLQAMDMGGKDGTIRRIFQGVNPSGVRVAHFREPTQDEATTTSSGGSTFRCPAGESSQSSTGRTMRACSSSGSTT